MSGLAASLGWGALGEKMKRAIVGGDHKYPALSCLSPPPCTSLYYSTLFLFYPFSYFEHDRYPAVLNEANAERLAQGLSRMRGAALKVGQMLSIQGINSTERIEREECVGEGGMWD